MGVLTYAQANKLTDKLVAAYKSEELSLASSYFDSIRALIRGDDADFRDYDVQSALTIPAKNAALASLTDAKFRNETGGFWSALNGLAAAASSVSSYIIDFDYFLRYYNYYEEETNNLGHSKWLALMLPDWYLAYYALTRVYPNPKTVGYALQKGTVYRGTTYTYGLRKHDVGGSETPGGDVDRTKYAGGRAYVYWEGATSASSGSYTITLTGEDENGNTGVTWAVTSTAIPASGNAQCLNSGDEKLVTKCTGIAVTGDVTNGDFYAEARLTRTYPPV